MAEPESFNKPHLLVPELTSPIQRKPSKSYSVFLCKSLFVALLLVVLPLFPSQAPEFIKQTMLTKCWELLHLLFIGIAVSYGLFGRKNAKMDNEIQSKLDNSQTYLSGILQYSSIFEDGHENPCGSDEKRAIHSWNPQYLESEVAVGNGSSILEEWKNPRSSIFQNCTENPSGSDEKKVSQPWNSQYCLGESMVVVSQENCVLDEWGKPKSIIDYKPLGLPVRSLRSRIIDHDIPESIKGNGSTSDSKGSCKNSDKIGNGKIRGLTPIHLDKKFKETVTLPSPLPWRSRSSRIEVREDTNTVNPPSHSRPLSVGEFKFDHLNSQSFWSPIFSQTSSMPSPPKKISPSSTISPEVPNSKMEDLEGENSSCWSSPRDSPSASTLRNGEASLLTMNARRFSIGSLSEMNVQRNCDGNLKDNLKDFSKRMKPLNADVKPSAPVKPLPRGKSVRTIRASEHVLEASKMGDICSDHGIQKVGKTCDKFEAISMENMERRARPGQLPQNTRRQNLDDLSRKQSPKLSKYQNAEKLDFSETNVVESEKDSESKFENFQVSSDEEVAQPDIVNDAELDPDEVDRKAGEFIAKFREQIRLQKIASMKGFSD